MDGIVDIEETVWTEPSREDDRAGRVLVGPLPREDILAQSRIQCGFLGCDRTSYTRNVADNGGDCGDEKLWARLGKGSDRHPFRM